MASTLHCAKVRVAAVVIGAVALLGGGADWALGGNLLVNPSFEAPALSPGSDWAFNPGQTIGSGWIAAGGGNAVVISNGYSDRGWYWPNATDGTQTLYVGDSGRQNTVYQDVNLAANTLYRLSFDMASLVQVPESALPYPSAKLTVAVSGPSTSLVRPFEVPGLSDFVSQTMQFSSADAGTYRISVTQLNGFPTNVDNFSLTAAVPVPSSVAGLLSLGMVGLVAGWRWRRKAST